MTDGTVLKDRIDLHKRRMAAAENEWLNYDYGPGGTERKGSFQARGEDLVRPCLLVNPFPHGFGVMSEFVVSFKEGTDEVLDARALRNGEQVGQRRTPDAGPRP